MNESKKASCSFIVDESIVASYTFIVDESKKASLCDSHDAISLMVLP